MKVEKYEIIDCLYRGNKSCILNKLKLSLKQQQNGCSPSKRRAEEQFGKSSSFCLTHVHKGAVKGAFIKCHAVILCKHKSDECVMQMLVIT